MDPNFLINIARHNASNTVLSIDVTPPAIMLASLMTTTTIPTTKTTTTVATTTTTVATTTPQKPTSTTEFEFQTDAPDGEGDDWRSTPQAVDTVSDSLESLPSSTSPTNAQITTSGVTPNVTGSPGYVTTSPSVADNQTVTPGPQLKAAMSGGIIALVVIVILLAIVVFIILILNFKKLIPRRGTGVGPDAQCGSSCQTDPDSGSETFSVRQPRWSPTKFFRCLCPHRPQVERVDPNSLEMKGDMPSRSDSNTTVASTAPLTRSSSLTYPSELKPKFGLSGEHGRYAKTLPPIRQTPSKGNDRLI